MPELPDVAGFHRVVAQVTELRVCEVNVHDASVLHGADAAEFSTALRGRHIGAPQRHGKWLEIPTRSATRAQDTVPEVLLHFGMTGSVRWCETDESEHPHDRVVFVLSSGKLHYRDMRKLTGVHLARRRADVAALLASLGPDALGISREKLIERLGSSRKRVKSALMDQGVVAGLGNLTVDEVLWRARLHPQRVVSTLSADELGRLHRAMGGVLGPAVRAGRVPADAAWLTGQRDVRDGSCPRCHTALVRGRLGGRSTLWCPACQPE